ncbi:MAG TPA: response regulator transcription factor [Kofleriaceae bacterium]|nr:response regulator transcription factor [Kofleriaceae bacterium]
MGAKSTIFLVDDHPVVRYGLREMVSRQPDLRVVGEARARQEALQGCDKLEPDVAIVDLSLGQETGFTLVSALRQAHPKMAILVLSMHDERIFAQRALQAGANGYVGKHEDTDVILQAVRRVLAGKTYVSEVVSEMLLSAASSPAGGAPVRSGLARLTNRELEILRLIGNGVKTADIASRLGIGAKTVETHRARIKEKLGVDSANEVLILAVNWLRDGFLDAPDAGR